ncbi:hypothetical protein ASF94_09735 [Acidovorax sp. Leaf160]|nr:hypothetical protein ASF94_09735 [Acidovorax sp. Leaf160]
MACEGVPLAAFNVSIQRKNWPRWLASLGVVPPCSSRIVFHDTPPLAQLAWVLGIVLQFHMDWYARRMLPSGRFAGAKVSFSAALSALIPLVPILPELSTETITFGGGCREAEPAGY